jgi:hypothetical protein
MPASPSRSSLYRLRCSEMMHNYSLTTTAKHIFQWLSAYDWRVYQF